MWDTHLHTEFSGDSKAKLSDMIDAGKRKGLRGMIFTDHLDWNYPNEPGLFDLDLYGYKDALNVALSDNPDIEIRTGIELGLQQHLSNRHRELLQKVSFDYVIGSVHVVNGRDPYYKDYFEGRSADEAYREYFECLRDNINDFMDFDSLGHLDYVVRYGIKNLGTSMGAMNFWTHRKTIEEILDILIRHGKALEINTGSFQSGLSEPNPAYEIIELYKKMGGELITLGSDAHAPEYVGDGLFEVAGRLKELGFNFQAVYINRIMHEMPL